ncbi:SMI1/KNR4 family protein [Bacillus sp. FJAT-45037]|uniref:SMI1/KNR4 family protein n=1 Tax=Bacillus sp. FJAT-45037 TaxID=2011007 RepID=UPI000C2346A8|nr:SMI1/KNR4 family protein [Bacillus sp. FJAT-45037]
MPIEQYQGKSFWKVPSEYKPGKKLTEEMVRKVEEMLDVSLPKEYVSLMMEQNGGELNYRYVFFEDDEAAIIPFFHELDEETGVGLSQIFMTQLHLAERQVLLTGDMHTWTSLDYRYDHQPRVVYFYETGDGQWGEELIAETFDLFLSKLFKKE